MYHTVSSYQYYHIIPLDNILYDAESLEDKDIWAFAYKEDERALNLICKPVKGQIKGSKYFYEYKANGKGLKKTGVTIYARYFADTYEEAVIGFNALVLKRISALETEITRLNDMLIHNN